MGYSITESDKPLLWKRKMKVVLWILLNETSMKCKVFWVVITTIVPLGKENNPFSCETNRNLRKYMVKMKWCIVCFVFLSLHRILCFLSLAITRKSK